MSNQQGAKITVYWYVARESSLTAPLSIPRAVFTSPSRHMTFNDMHNGQEKADQKHTGLRNLALSESSGCLKN